MDSSIFQREKRPSEEGQNIHGLAEPLCGTTWSLDKWNCDKLHRGYRACPGTRKGLQRGYMTCRRISRLCRRKTAPLLLWNFVGLSFFFWAQNICTTTFSHHILVCRNRHLSRYSICPSYYYMQVISYKTDLTNYMCNFPVCISMGQFFFKV